MFRPRVLLKGQHPAWAIGVQERYARISEESEDSEGSDKIDSKKAEDSMKF